MPTTLLTPEQVCEILQISRDTLYHWVQARKIGYIKMPNGALRFRSDWLENWIASKTIKQH